MERDMQTRSRNAGDVYRRKYSRGQHNNSPFVDEIVNAPFIEDFDGAFLLKYDGTQDPEVHIDEFDMQMCVRGIDEPIISRIFATTLTGAAQKWFHSLSPRSIRNFEDFGQKFLLNFATSKKQPKSEFALGKIQQKPGETLQSYLDRFKEAALQVQGLEEKVHVHLIAAGLHGSSRLAKSIYKDPVKSLTEFRSRSKKYLDLEQMEIANAAGRDRERKVGSPNQAKEQQGGQKQGRNPDSKFRVGKFEAKYEKYTPLNASRSQIWREVASTEMRKVERPRPLYNKSGADQSRFCEFHNGPGHTTEQCWDLRDAIEKFVRDGRLRQYVIKTQGKKNKRKEGSES